MGTYHVDQDNREEAVAAQAAAQDPDDRDPTASVSPDYTRRGTVTLLQAGERGQEAQRYADVLLSFPSSKKLTSILQYDLGRSTYPSSIGYEVGQNP